jgi:hypothetical protein
VAVGGLRRHRPGTGRGRRAAEGQGRCELTSPAPLIRKNEPDPLSG